MLLKFLHSRNRSCFSVALFIFGFGLFLAETNAEFWPNQGAKFGWHDKTDGIEFGPINPITDQWVPDQNYIYESAGDINGDGIDDIMIADNREEFGKEFTEITVMFGMAEGGGLPPMVPIDSVDFTGFKIRSRRQNVGFGSSIAAVGDVNSDGIDDILIGAQYDVGHDSMETGGAYILFGARTFPETVYLFPEQGPHGSKGVFIQGYNEYALDGIRVSSAGDFNGDGVKDMIVSSFYYNTVYVVYGKPTGVLFPNIIPLKHLQRQRMGCILTDDSREMYETYFGYGISAAGDVNGDGYDDVVVGAPYDYSEDLDTYGAVFVFYGSPYLTQIDLEDFNDQNLGYTIKPQKDAQYSNLGRYITGNVDVNKDGLADIIVSHVKGFDYSKGIQQFDPSLITVIFGSNSLNSNANILLGSPPPRRTYTIDNILGYQWTAFRNAPVAGLGDFNGDGIDDFAFVSQPFTNHNTYQASIMIVHGRKEGFPERENITTWEMLQNVEEVAIDWKKSSKLQDLTPFCPGLNGAHVRRAGDINKDGKQDLLFSYSSCDSALRVVMVKYGSDPSRGEYTYPRIIGDVGFVAQDKMDVGGPMWQSFNVNASYKLSPIGDINGDGIKDYAFGAINKHMDQSVVCVYYGKVGGLGKRVMNLAAQIEPSKGFCITGRGGSSKSHAGITISALGDINGDDIEDFIIGAPHQDITFGGAYVIFGKRGFSRDYFEMSDLQSSDGFKMAFKSAESKLYKKGTLAGANVIGIGDFNGDRLNDILISGHAHGEVYIIMGRSQWERMVYIDHQSPNQFIRIHDGSEPYMTLFGEQAAAAGDFNGDGLADVVIGSIYDQNNHKVVTGAAYVIYGGVDLKEVDVNDLFTKNKGFKISAPNADGSQPEINDNVSKETLVEYHNIGISVAGNLDLNHDGYKDVVIGANGVDDTWRPISEKIFEVSAVYIVYGAPNKNLYLGPAGIDVLEKSPSFGFRISYDTPSNRLGDFVSGGDFNGDGIDDLLFSVGSRIGDGFTSQFDIMLLPGMSSDSAWHSDVPWWYPYDYGMVYHNAFENNIWGSRWVDPQALGDINNDGCTDISVGWSDRDIAVMYGKKDLFGAVRDS